MAIKGHKAADVVSVYDPALGAYHEVTIEALRTQLAGLGFTEDQIEERIAALKKSEEV
jgi:hypothetical protein